MLDRHPNGGDVIIARTLFTSTLLFLVFIGIKHWIDPGRSLTFSVLALRQEALASLSVFGALVAGVYATLYARFSAQWSYLAGLFNQILKTEIDLATTADKEKLELLAYWKASFIEDAVDLHLATKRMFVPAIRDWLTDEAVRDAFVEGALGGDERLKKLEAELALVHS